MTPTPSGRASRPRSSQSTRARRALAAACVCVAVLTHTPIPRLRLCRSKCENDIDKWYTEDFHSDNFEHTTSGQYGPANYQTETLAMVFWCHNKITSCQIKIDGVTIGENSTRVMA